MKSENLDDALHIKKWILKHDPVDPEREKLSWMKPLLDLGCNYSTGSMQEASLLRVELTCLDTG